MENRCVCCGNPIPEGRQVCWTCEHEGIKVGKIMQSQNATSEEVENAYEWLYASLEDTIDMC